MSFGIQELTKKKKPDWTITYQEKQQKQNELKQNIRQIIFTNPTDRDLACEIAMYAKGYFVYLAKEFREDEEIVDLLLHKKGCLLFNRVDEKFWNNERFIAAINSNPIYYFKIPVDKVNDDIISMFLKRILKHYSRNEFYTKFITRYPEFGVYKDCHIGYQFHLGRIASEKKGRRIRQMPIDVKFLFLSK